MTPRRLRIAWIGAELSGSLGEYCSRLVLPHLAPHFSIVRYTDLRPDNQHLRIGTHESRHYLRAAADHRKDPFDLFFYLVEDGETQRWTRQASTLQPGIIWFLDFLFEKNLPAAMSPNPWREVHRTLKSHVRWPQRCVAELPIEPPFGHREASRSVTCLFATERFTSQFRVQQEQDLVLKGIPSFTLPLPIPKPLQANTLATTTSQAFTVATAASTRLDHRCHLWLEAFALLQKQPAEQLPKLLWMLSPPEEVAARELLTEFQIKDAELIVGRSPERWMEELGRVSVALHTQYSLFHHQSPYIELSLSAGCAVVMSDFGDADFYPSSFVYKVPVGDEELGVFSELLAHLATRESPPPTTLETQVAWANKRANARSIADEIEVAFRGALPVARLAATEWQKNLDLARKELVAEAFHNTATDDAEHLQWLWEQWHSLGIVSS